MEGNIFSAQLNNQLLFASGLNSRTTVCDENKLIAIGRLSFLPLSEHLQLHISQCIEQQQTSNCAELQESINITVLLKGKIKFRVANKYYHFEVTNKPIAFANIVAQPEPFTRYLHSHQEVEKLTLSVSKEWVNARLQRQANALFANTKVVKLPLSDKAITLTQQLMQTPSSPSLCQQLECEGNAIQWLSCFFPYLVANNQTTHALYRLPPQTDMELRKNTAIDLLNSGKSVEQVSQELAMSVSSLQRFFKRCFNTTPKQYVKQSRLNKARHALLVEGLSIGEAAYLANYDHTANFIAAFKKQFGVTPMQFIKTHQADTQVT